MMYTLGMPPFSLPPPPPFSSPFLWQYLEFEDFRGLAFVKDRPYDINQLAKLKRLRG